MLSVFDYGKKVRDGGVHDLEHRGTVHSSPDSRRIHRYEPGVQTVLTTTTL